DVVGLERQVLAQVALVIQGVQVERPALAIPVQRGIAQVDFGREAAGLRHEIGDGQRNVGERDRPRRGDLAHDEYSLAAIVPDGNVDLGLDEIGAQLARQVVANLRDRAAGSADAPSVRKEDVAVGAYQATRQLVGRGTRVGQLGVVPYRNLQNVLRADDVLVID